MKYISFAIPCYNSAEYMGHAIESAVVGGEDVEVIVVNDGSKDDTLQIAKQYQEKYPTIVKVIDQENGGHGAAVNAGLKAATGAYYKVLDSDDWLDEASVHQLLKTIKNNIDHHVWIDMYIANYVYEKVGAKHKNVVRYTNALPTNRPFTWNDVGHFRIDQYILMHSVIYRTELLKEIHLSLPRHTFYVDNIYVYYPLPYVKYMYYMDIDLYRYFIGRDDQSVNEEVMIRRADQQIFITHQLIDMYRLQDLDNPRLRSYMTKYLAIMMTVSSIVLIRSHNANNLRKKDQLWQYLKEKDEKTYRKIRYGILGTSMNLPGKSGRKISEYCYLLAKKVVGFQK